MGRVKEVRLDTINIIIINNIIASLEREQKHHGSQRKLGRRMAGDSGPIPDISAGGLFGGLDAASNRVRITRRGLSSASRSTVATAVQP